MGCYIAGLTAAPPRPPPPKVAGGVEGVTPISTTPARCVASDRNDPSLGTRFLKYFVYYTWVFPKSDSEAEHGPRQFLTEESETAPPAAELTG